MRQLIVDNYIIEAKILDILQLLQITLTNGKLRAFEQKSDNILVTCPHHAGGHETKPAGNIYIGEDPRLPYGYYRCFVCDFKGPFLKFVAECFNSSLDFAKDWLIKNFKHTLLKSAVLLDEPINLNKKSFHYLDASELDTYQKWCPYLAQRKLSRETCEKFNVRYDAKHRQIIFPCYDSRGRLLMLPKRSIDTKTFYLDRNVEKPVYCLDYIIKNDIKAAIVTEGPFDCLTAYEYGMPAVAMFGNISDDQIKQLNHSCLNIIYAMFDNDDAGRNFCRILKSKLDKRILVIDVNIPNGKKDINDLTREEFTNIFKNIQ